MFELPLLHEIGDCGHCGKDQGGVPEQRQNDVHDEPGAAQRLARPVRYRIPERGHEGHHEDKRKDKDAQAFDFITPVDDEEGERHEPGAERHGFEEIVRGKMVLHQPLFDDRNQLEERAETECGEGGAEETFAPAQNRDDGIEKAERIKSGGDAEPEDTGFAHLGDSPSV